MSLVTTRLGSLDLTGLPTPDALENVVWTDIVVSLKESLLEKFPDAADVINDHLEPLVYLTQNFATREVQLRTGWNDKVRAVLLPFSTGTNLDALGAGLGVARLVVREADPITGTPRVMESDDAFRRRIQLAPDAFATAGSREAYVFHALSAHGAVQDAVAYNYGDLPGQLMPGQIAVAILIDQTFDAQDVWTQVRAHLMDDKIKPLNDELTVHIAERIVVPVTGTLWLQPGPDASSILTVAKERLKSYFKARYRIGAILALSGIQQAVHVPPVETSILVTPTADLDPGPFKVFVPGDFNLTTARVNG